MWLVNQQPGFNPYDDDFLELQWQINNGGRDFGGDGVDVDYVD